MSTQRTIVIIGAGVAGITTAKLLAKRSRVILIEKKFAPVAQSGHLHVLLAKGQQLLKDYFPKVFEKIASTCPAVNWGSGTYWRTPAGPMHPRPLKTETYLLSRNYLDELMLADLRQNTTCQLIEGSVDGLQFSEDRHRVAGVTVGNRAIACDLCVDCSGRNAKGKKLLEAEFGKRVPTERLETTLRYFTTFARAVRPRDFQQAYFQIDPYNPAVSPKWSQKITKFLMNRVIHKGKTNAAAHQDLVDVLHMEKSPRQVMKLRNLL